MVLAPFRAIEQETRSAIGRARPRPAWYDVALNRLIVAAIRQAIIDTQRQYSNRNITDASEFLRSDALIWLDATIPDHGIDPESWREWVDRGCPLAGGKLGLQCVVADADAGEINNRADDLEDI